MRNQSKRVIERNEAVIAAIRELKAEHPFWGYRRIWAYLKFRQGWEVNKKRIYRLMKQHSLLVTDTRMLKAKRYSNRSKPRADRPNQFWGTDMTKIKLDSWGWVYLVIVLDWYTKEIIGYSLSMTSKTQDWLDALHQAVQKRFPEGIKESENNVSLISDNGCQPTSLRYMQTCSDLNLKQIFTTWCNPKGNADTERIMRTIKEDLIWVKDWDNPFELATSLEKWVNNYNTDYPHQSLKHLTPCQCYEKYKKEGVMTLLVHA